MSVIGLVLRLLTVAGIGTSGLLAQALRGAAPDGVGAEFTNNPTTTRDYSQLQTDDDAKVPQIITFVPFISPTKFRVHAALRRLPLSVRTISPA